MASSMINGQQLINYIKANRLEEHCLVVAFKNTPDAVTCLSSITGLRINGNCIQLNEETFEGSYDGFVDYMGRESENR